MLKHSLIVGFFLLAAALSARAADTDTKKEKPREEKKDVEKKTEIKHKVEVKEERSGSKFTHFWVHTVGGSIGNGLKSGANKISNAFD